MGCSELLLLVSLWAWLWCHQISMHGGAVICPGVFGIGYKGRALTGSSSLDAAPVTGSLLFNAPVCHLAICCAAGFSSCGSVVVTVSGLLCSDCFSGELV